MKLRILTILIICLLINLLLVNSQEAKCPPDCSNSKKITDESYLNPDSYKKEDFYKNSDPKKWDFTNVDYSKIPVERYRELPYENPAIEHWKLDPQKYVTAMECSTCSFKVINPHIKYSTDGVIHPKNGLARIPSNYPPNTLFIAKTENIEIILPKKEEQIAEEEKFKLDISKVGSATISTNNQKVILSTDQTIDGRLSFVDNKPFVAKNDELTLDGIKIKPKGNDVFVYFDGKTHQGNYISYGEKDLIAEGNNFDLEFSKWNNLVNVFGDKDIKSRNIIEISAKMADKSLRYGVPELWQDDYLYFSIGDGRTKNGKIDIINRDDNNLLPLVKTNGYIRMWNDRNDVTINDNTVNQNYYITVPGIREGSVSMQIVAGDDKNKVYTFDENRDISIVDKMEAEIIDTTRYNLRGRNIILTGFFDQTTLQDFYQNLIHIEQTLDIDFAKVGEIKGQNIEVIEGDKRLRLSHDTIAQAAEEDSKIFFMSDRREGGAYKLSTYSSPPPPSKEFTLSHEIGHLLTDKEFDKEFIETGKKFGMPFTLQNNIGPNELFPTIYSKQNLPEFKSEVFRLMANRPEWFTDPYEGGLDEQDIPIRLHQPVSFEILKQRQAFRDIWLEELKKYKK